MDLLQKLLLGSVARSWFSKLDAGDHAGGIINICSSLLYAVALQSQRVHGKTFSDINLLLRGLLELLDETGGNRGKVIIAKQ